VQPLSAPGLSIIYSGNFGRAHDATTIAEAIAALNGAEGFQFIFGGGGSRQAWIRDFCEVKGIRSVQFPPYCERDELRARLMACDIGLVTQHSESAGSVVPSKSYGIMAAGRPVLYIGPRHSTIALLIERYGCGWQIDCNDVDGLVQLLRRLSDNKELVYAAGERAYQTFVNRYQRSIGVTRIAAAGLLCEVERETESLSHVVNCAKVATAEGSGTRTSVVQNG
jgi:glycosyltransferase involved in cell wall biosynthesis